MLGNNKTMRVTGKVNVKLFLQGVCYSIANVYWFPKLTNNILRIEQLQEKELVVLFKDGSYNVWHPYRGKM